MAKARFALTVMILRENLRGILITGLLVGACILAIGFPIAKRSSPIVILERLTGTVATVLDASPSPNTGITGGFRYLYGIRLDENGPLVFVYDAAPRVAGSNVSIERQHRENGTDTFRLLRE
ncbi:hypothetical protein [Mesorhizobium sp.]|uniref:hypothetical protein n=1 Tax=Mesorhizobium sp. TaxID=1871066 RepID=UPI000FEA6DD6|nr:hypothetical protein [Mesorhizobium sp.]RWC47712.1 MAG: hypothetical protein EOS55_15045 [Mesorhizobium sp.]RWC61649.1 MAG: hypothetical protein EOS29_17955 [Mesorhizobium sp.]RWC62202.1 MAG: hypothetical protein EOS56_09335 [Mesorhizobium sp.]